MNDERRGTAPDAPFVPVGTGLNIYRRSCNRCMENGKAQADGGFARVPWSTRMRWVCVDCLPSSHVRAHLPLGDDFPEPHMEAE